MTNQEFLNALNEEKEALFGIIQFQGAPDIIGINGGKPFDYSDLIDAAFDRLFEIAARAENEGQKIDAQECVNACIEFLKGRDEELGRKQEEKNAYLFIIRCLRDGLIGIINLHGEPDEYGFHNGVPFDFHDQINMGFDELHAHASLARGTVCKAVAKKALLDCMAALAEKVDRMAAEPKRTTRKTVYKLRWTKKATGETGIAEEFTGEGFTDQIFATRDGAEDAAELYERTSLNTEIYTVIPCEVIAI